MTGFGKIQSFIYGDTIQKAYGFAGATVHGSISGGNAQVELATPVPFRSFGPVNQRMAAAYAETQAGIEAMDALHEILHLAGKNWYDDFAYANTVAAMNGVKPPDFSGMAYKDAVRKASEYWNGALRAACKPR